MKRPVLLALSAFFSVMVSVFADLTIGQSYKVNLVDVDGTALSTADGHILSLVLSSQSGADKARYVGDRTPDFCLGNPMYRMITVVVFDKPHSKPIRMILASLVRHRLNAEGHRLQNRYDKLKIKGDARKDVSAVADFDGTITRQLGLQPGPDIFHVFVFGKNGDLIKQWSDVPTAEDMTAALKQN